MKHIITYLNNIHLFGSISAVSNTWLPYLIFPWIGTLASPSVKCSVWTLEREESSTVTLCTPDSLSWTTKTTTHTRSYRPHPKENQMLILLTSYSYLYDKFGEYQKNHLLLPKYQFHRMTMCAIVYFLSIKCLINKNVALGFILDLRHCREKNQTKNPHIHTYKKNQKKPTTPLPPP